MEDLVPTTAYGSGSRVGDPHPREYFLSRHERRLFPAILQPFRTCRRAATSGCSRPMPPTTTTKKRGGDASRPSASTHPSTASTGCSVNLLNGASEWARVIERLATLMDEWIDDGEVEIVRQFAMPLPVMVITTVLGFPLDDIEQLKKWSEAWVMPFSQPCGDNTCRAGVAFQRYIWSHFCGRAEHLTDDVLLHFAHARSTTPIR